MLKSQWVWLITGNMNKSKEMFPEFKKYLFPTNAILFSSSQIEEGEAVVDSIRLIGKTFQKTCFSPVQTVSKINSEVGINTIKFSELFNYTSTNQNESVAKDFSIDFCNGTRPNRGVYFAQYKFSFLHKYY